MGIGIYPKLEKDIVGIDPLEISGKALHKAIYNPWNKKTEAPVVQLERFIEYDPEELAMYVDNLGVDTEEIPIQEPTWFNAAEGISTLEQILQNSQLDDNAEEDAKKLLQILKIAGEQHVGFYLTTDMP